MTGEFVRHDPIDIAARAAEAPRVARNGIVFVKVGFGDDKGSWPRAATYGAVTYEIKAGGSARILNDGCEAVIENGMIIGYRHLESEAV